MYTLPTSFDSFDGSVSAIVTGGNPPYEYQWTGPVTGNTAAMNNLPGGSYLLVVTDDSGCEATVAISLIPTILDCYQGISVITPNEDGRNDFFLLTCTLDAPNHLYIFNRYGGLVWETDNYFNNWDHF